LNQASNLNSIEIPNWTSRRETESGNAKSPGRCALDDMSKRYIGRLHFLNPLQEV